MLIIKDLQGKTEALPDVQGVEVNEEVNGDFSISFTSFSTERNAHSYPLLQNESIVELDGQDFKNKNLVEIKNRKTAKAQHIFFGLIGHQVYSYMGGTKSVDETFSFILAGSGWTFENVDVDNHELLSNFGEGNALALIRDACNIYNCEIQIEPGKHLKIYKQIGQDKDEQFRYKHNIKTFRKTEDSTGLATVIKGFGADGLEVEYRSPNVEIFGEIHAEPVRDDRFTIAESLLEECKSRLKDIPDVSFDIELTQLGFEAGLGDRIWTIYEPMGIDLKLRIMAIKWFPFTNRAPIVTMSNKNERGLSDQLAKTRIEIDKNKKETKSRFEQTNEKFTLEVERVDESIAALEIEADNVQITVQSLNGRMGNAESQLSVQAGQITSRVTYSDYNGNTIASLINQTAENVSISAQAIDLDGIVRTSGNVSIGYPGDTSYKAIILGQVSRITQQADNMRLESTRIDVDASYVNFYGQLNFANANVSGLTVTNATYANYLGGYSAGSFAKNALGHQDISLEITSTGQLRANVNGRTATFNPSSWG
ncbi:phage tail protein [Bacillus infantis]|uniref:phage tail protein n=1 Tax=Bacillus infantis TaxID=324767 RepID=UPI00344F57CF